MDKLGSLGSFSQLIPPEYRPATVSAREKAYWIIRDQIIYMQLKPGEPLSDKLLAEQLDMSRTPVREALILLSAYNMVVMKPQIGTFVTPINSDWVDMEQFSRLTMEKEMIRRACERTSPALYNAYRKNIEHFTEIKFSSDPDRIRTMHDLDNDFHGMAFAANGRLDSYLHMYSYMQHIERLRVLALMMETDGDIIDDHSAIANAVEARDVNTALIRLEEHLSIYKESLKAIKTKNPEYFILG